MQNNRRSSSAIQRTLRRMSRLLVGGFLVCVLAVPVQAADFQVYSRTIGDVYAHLRSNGDAISRHRVHQMLGLNGFDLTGDGSNKVFFVSSFRLDADFGIADWEVDQMDQLSRQDIAILYAYIEARDLMGFLDIKVGRQYEIDSIDMLLYDGVKFRFNTPWYFSVNTMAGVEAINQWGPITVSQQALDGTAEKTILADGSFVDPTPRLVFGGGVSLIDLPFTHLDLQFRRIQSLGETAADGEVQAESGRVNQQRVGGAFSQRIMEGLFVNAGASYDFYQALVNEIRGGLRYRPVHMVELEAGYSFVLPSFDADSIWNVFSWRPINRAEERVRVFFGDEFWIYAGAYQSFFQVDASVTDDSDVEETIQDLGGSVGGRWIIGGRGSIHLDFTTQHGYGGDQSFVDFGGSYNFLDRKLGVEGRLMALYLSDQVQDRLNGLMFGGQVSGYWRFMEGSQLNVMVEQVYTELQPSWTRVLTVLDVDVWW